MSLSNVKHHMLNSNDTTAQSKQNLTLNQTNNSKDIFIQDCQVEELPFVTETKRRHQAKDGLNTSLERLNRKLKEVKI